jgi:hypothetical protein
MAWVSRVWPVLAALLLQACPPEIGDSCSNAADCSQTTERTCDTTVPGGYCTEFGCSADGCPAEAACIGYQSVVSTAVECASLQAPPRLQRTACMRKCSRDSDCREGYVCVDMRQPNAWGALLLENAGSGKVCTLRPPPEPQGVGEVCAPRGSLPAPVLPPVPPELDAGLAPDAQ